VGPAATEGRHKVEQNRNKRAVIGAGQPAAKKGGHEVKQRELVKGCGVEQGTPQPRRELDNQKAHMKQRTV